MWNFDILEINIFQSRGSKGTKNTHQTNSCYKLSIKRVFPRRRLEVKNKTLKNSALIQFKYYYCTYHVNLSFQIVLSFGHVLNSCFKWNFWTRSTLGTKKLRACVNTTAYLQVVVTRTWKLIELYCVQWRHLSQ